MHNRFFRLSLTFFFSFVIYFPSVSAESIEEVVVEAERQSGIDVLEEAASLKSFDLEDLETHQIASFGDVANFVPGLTASPTGSQGLRFTIRGIGARDSQLGVETRVGLYIDDAFLGRAVGSFDLVDLENVIVEKGPTGFTGGRNAVGGSISLISAKPMLDEFLGKVNFGLGSYGSNTVSGIFNIPVSVNFSTRIGFAKSVRDGWVENEGLGEDFWGYDRDSYRASFLWQANESISLNYSYDLNKAKNQPAFFQAIPDTNGGENGTYTREEEIVLSQWARQLVDPVVPGPFSNNRQEKISSNVLIENGTTESSGHSLSIEFDLGGDHRFTFSGTYREAETLNTFYFYPNVNKDALSYRAKFEPFPTSLKAVNTQIPESISSSKPTYPEYGRFCCILWGARFIPEEERETLSVNTLLNSPPGGDLALRDHSQFSIEFKQEGTLFDGQLDYVAGIYYFNERTGNGQQLPNLPYSDPNFLDMKIGDGITHDLFWSDFIELISLMDFEVEDPDLLATSFVSINNIDTDSYAAFTQLKYHPVWNDRLHLTFGLRHTYEKKSLDRTPLRTITLDRLDDKYLYDENDWTSLDPEFKIQYDVSDEGFVYLRYSEGFRPGNFNVLTRKISDLGFEAEFIDAYEVGYKSSLFDGAISVEFAIFRNEMENGQSTIRNILSPLQRSIINTDSNSEGIELNLELNLTDELSMSLEYAYLRSHNDRFINPFYIDYEYAIKTQPNTQSSITGIENVTLPLTASDSYKNNGIITTADDVIINRLESECYNDFQNDPLPNISRRVDTQRGVCTDRQTNFGAPINSLLVTLEYAKFFDWGELRGNLSYSHKDSYFVGAAVDITDRDIVDLRLTGEFEMVNGTGEIALWSQNVLDNEYTINSLDVTAFAADVALYGTPRTFGIDFGYEW